MKKSHGVDLEFVSGCAWNNVDLDSNFRHSAGDGVIYCAVSSEKAKGYRGKQSLFRSPKMCVFRIGLLLRAEQ